MRISGFLKFSMLGVILMLLPACNGILDGIYDEKPEGDLTGFLKFNEETGRGTVYVDATSYTRWVYLDLHNRNYDTINVYSEQPEPDQWDIAVHRYDAKTNGGAVLQTEMTEFDVLVQSGKIPEGEYVQDVMGKITIDMSNMMDGNIIYADSFINEELCLWLDVNTNSMPPIYTLSNKIYVVRLKDDTYAAVRLTNFIGESSGKGFLTIDYIYPLDF